MAESEALEYAKRDEVDMVTVCASIVIGLVPQTISSSSLLLLSLLKGGRESMEDKDGPLVDVSNVAHALLPVYKKPDARGRYICTSYAVRTRALADKLKSMYPKHDYPKSFTKVGDDDVMLSSGKLQSLGWKYKPLEETMSDAVKNYEERSLLHKE